MIQTIRHGLRPSSCGKLIKRSQPIGAIQPSNQNPTGGYAHQTAIADSSDQPMVRLSNRLRETGLGVAVFAGGFLDFRRFGVAWFMVAF